MEQNKEPDRTHPGIAPRTGDRGTPCGKPVAGPGYITQLLTGDYQMKENGGNPNMNNTRTMAFQISEELFQRLKRHLERESARTGRKVTQREFVLGLIERVLEEAEQREQEAPTSEEQTDEVMIPEDAQQEDSAEREEAEYADTY